MDTTKQLGKRVQRLRKQKGLTQSQLAETISVEVVTVSRIENGTHFPIKENLENITKAVPSFDLLNKILYIHLI